MKKEINIDFGIPEDDDGHDGSDESDEWMDRDEIGTMIAALRHSRHKRL